MNQHPLTGGALPNCLDGADLFGQALERPARLRSDDFESDAPSASDASLMSADRPRLSLVRPEDHDDQSEVSETDSILAEPSNQVSTELSESLGELWGQSLDFDAKDCSESRSADISLDERLPPLSETFELDDLLPVELDRNLPAPVEPSGDTSDAECITISNPLAEVPIAASAVAKTSPAAGLTAPAPQRIGSGRLSPTKLTWKPGDPFGGSRESTAGRFRWEIMLTTACVTALCGLACIWMLRTILA